MKRQKNKSEAGQIGIGDINLSVGDKLYKDGALYGEVTDIGDSLYFISITGRNNEIPTPFYKKNLIEKILMGGFTLENVTYK